MHERFFVTTGSPERRGSGSPSTPFHHVGFEPELETRKRPDVLVVRSDGREVLVEVTSQTQDKAMREIHRYGWQVQEHTRAVEKAHAVVVTVRSETSLAEHEVRHWFALVAEVAATAALDGRTLKVPFRDNVATVHPGGTSVESLHDGPSLSDDAWPRLADRIVEKADETRGGPPAWMRIEVDGSLLALTTLTTLEPEARLRALAGNVAAALAGRPRPRTRFRHPTRARVGQHGRAPGLGRDSDDPVRPRPPRLGIAGTCRRVRTSSGPTAVLCGLPGGWTRTAFVLPNQAGAHEDPLGRGLALAAEGGWLDWALAKPDQPSVGELWLDA